MPLVAGTPHVCRRRTPAVPGVGVGAARGPACELVSAQLDVCRFLQSPMGGASLPLLLSAKLLETKRAESADATLVGLLGTITIVVTLSRDHPLGCIGNEDKGV